MRHDKRRPTAAKAILHGVGLSEFTVGLIGLPLGFFAHFWALAVELPLGSRRYLFLGVGTTQFSCHTLFLLTALWLELGEIVAVNFLALGLRVFLLGSAVWLAQNRFCF